MCSCFGCFLLASHFCYSIMLLDDRVVDCYFPILFGRLGCKPSCKASVTFPVFFSFLSLCFCKSRVLNEERCLVFQMAGLIVMNFICIFYLSAYKDCNISFLLRCLNTLKYHLVVVGVAAIIIEGVLPLDSITLLGILDLHLHAAVITTLRLREGSTRGMLRPLILTICECDIIDIL